MNWHKDTHENTWQLFFGPEDEVEGLLSITPWRQNLPWTIKVFGRAFSFGTREMDLKSAVIQAFEIMAGEIYKITADIPTNIGAHV